MPEKIYKSYGISGQCLQKPVLDSFKYDLIFNQRHYMLYHSLAVNFLYKESVDDATPHGGSRVFESLSNYFILIYHHELCNNHVRQRRGWKEHQASLLQLYPFKQDRAFIPWAIFCCMKRDKESIYCENLDREINADILIFATKHQSGAGTKSLSVHIPGNFGKAEMGGKEKLIVHCSCFIIKSNVS